MKKNQSGFSAVAALSFLVILGILGFTGWYVWHTKEVVDTSNSLAATNTSTQISKPASKSTLVIKEWGVQLTLPAIIKDANYTIENKPRISDTAVPNAFLSTKQIDADKACRPDPSNHESPIIIAQYSPDDVVATGADPNVSMPASQAVKDQPDIFKQAGQHVYFFNLANGLGAGSCSRLIGNNFEVPKAFQTAFNSLTTAE